MNKIGKKLDSKFLSHLQGSIDVSPACVIIAEAPSGEVIYINEAVKRFRENDDIKINGDMIEDYMSSWKEYSSDGKLLSGEEMPLGRAILFGEIVDNEEIIVELDDGRKKWALASAAPVYDEDKNIIAGSVIWYDITKQKEEVEKNRKKDQQLIQQSKLAQIGTMLSMIAHQWRQPLTSISMGANNILVNIELNSIDENTLRDNVKGIVSTTEKLSKTINDFSNFYKPNKQSVIIKLEDVIEKSLNIIKPSLINNNINIIEEYSSDEEIKLYDSEIMQVILNILINAEENFQEKQIKNQKIIIKTENRTISICDNGGGIPEDIIDKIFDPYFSTKDKKNGAGLGLYMSKTIVEDHHNGKLSAENIDDGVCLRIELGIISEK